MDDFIFDDEADLEVEMEIEAEKAQAKAIETKGKKKKKSGDLVKTLLEEAKNKGHAFLYEQGRMDCGQYRSCLDAKSFFKEYFPIPTDRRAAYELIPENQEVMFYLDIEHKELF